VTDLDFAYTGTGTISGFPWFDANGDGVMDPDEPLLAGAIVDLIWAGPDGIFGTADDVAYQTTAPADGPYEFFGLPAGDYQVIVDPTTLPDGVGLVTFDPDLVPDGATNLSLAPAGGASADFGFAAAGEISGSVFHDVDGDGIGDIPLAGIDVSVTWPGPDGIPGTADDVTFATSTAPDGSYSFVGLPDGTYLPVIDPATLPTGLDLETLAPAAPVTIDPVTPTVSGLDFAYTGTGEISGVLWFDVDGDGVQDPGEPVLGGVGLELVWAGFDGIPGTADDVIYPATTTPDGSYMFANLPPGDYDLIVDPVTLPPGLGAGTFDPDGVLDAATALTLGVGETAPPADFGFTGTGEISGVLWFDIDGDGIQDPDEPPLDGVPMTLTWFGFDGVPGGGDDVVYVGTTAPDGSYVFPMLPAGEYDLVVDQTALPVGSSETADPDATFDSATTISLAPGQEASGLDFAYSGGGGVSGEVLLDVDGDGVSDPEEIGIPGVTVETTWVGLDGIPGTADDIVYTTVTDTSGAFDFGLLPAGNYEIVVDITTVPDGLVATFDPDGDPLSTTSVTIGDGEIVSGIEFGYAGTASLGDQVWFDIDADALEGATEPDLADITVHLQWAGFDGTLGTADDMYLSTATVAGNSYLFEYLPAGEFRLSIDPATLPAGLVQTYDLDGGFDFTTLATLSAGEHRRDVDFGYVGTGSIGQTVWEDLDGDGVQDPDEPGLGGADVTLAWVGPDGVAGTDDDVTWETVSDATGAYSFENLPAGDFTLQVLSASLTGMGSTTPTDQVIVLAAGETYVLGNFGFRSEILPVTGFESGMFTWFGLLLLLAGALFVAATRRRRYTA
jgi:LPXTG-motif cell wall-anchored protein